jgi:hypothetical protein
MSNSDFDQECDLALVAGPEQLPERSFYSSGLAIMTARSFPFIHGKCSSRFGRANPGCQLSERREWPD